MSNDIRLTFVNKTNLNNSDITIFQKNETPDIDHFAVAWHVLKDPNSGSRHEFNFPSNITINVESPSGTAITPAISTQAGELLSVEHTTSGDTLSYAAPSPSSEEVQLRNDLQTGAINANIYKDGKLLAKKTEIPPGGKAAFKFNPSIWIGVSSNIEEGDMINASTLSDTCTELNLLGICSADIVMTGGGVGPDAEPYQFKLENIKREP